MDLTEYRLALPQEVPQVVDFLNMVFSMAHERHDFRALLPKAYAHDDLWKMQYVAVRDGRILAAVTLLPLMLLPHPGITLKAGFVGGVAVHPYFRGEGHMRRLMALLLREARECGFDLLVLGGQRQRYGYYGFGKADPVLSYEINSANVRHALRDADDAGITFEAVNADDADVLEKISRTYRAGLNICERGDRLYEYLTGWKAVPEAILWHGSYIGYCCRNETEVYEFRLEDAGILPNVIKAFVKKYGCMQGSLALHDSACREAITDIAEDISLTDSGMIRVLNWQNVLEKMLSVRAAIRPIADGCSRFRVEGEGQYRLAVSHGQVSVTAEAEETEPPLPPEKAVDLLFSLGGALQSKDAWLRELLPLPFHMGTMDHF